MHLGGVGPRAHVWENHNPFDGQTIQSWSFLTDGKKSDKRNVRYRDCKKIRGASTRISPWPDSALPASEGKTRNAPGEGHPRQLKWKNKAALYSALLCTSPLACGVLVCILSATWTESRPPQLHDLSTPAASSSAGGSDGSLCVRIIASLLLWLHQ